MTASKIFVLKNIVYIKYCIKIFNKCFRRLKYNILYINQVL